MNKQDNKSGEKRVKKLYCFSDGGARGNPGPSAIGFLIKDDKGKVLVEQGGYIGKATNNVAEYSGLIQSLKWMIKNKKMLMADSEALPSAFYFYFLTLI